MPAEAKISPDGVKNDLFLRPGISPEQLEGVARKGAEETPPEVQEILDINPGLGPDSNSRKVVRPMRPAPKKEPALP